MRRLLSQFLALLTFAVAPAAAGPLEDGVAAAQKADYATALRLWRPLAEQGNSDAQFYLGGMYDAGKGVQQDEPVAVFWVRKAAEQGNSNAQIGLGLMYENGRRRLPPDD